MELYMFEIALGETNVRIINLLNVSVFIMQFHTGRNGLLINIVVKTMFHLEV